ncbi:MAG TPA: AAA family ATPase [Actinopolymorphaceae bacterium]
MKARAFLITGVMAAGKSTVAQELAERLDRSAHVRGDVFRRMIVNGGVRVAPDDPEDALTAALRLRHRQAALVADAYADAGFVPVVQDVVLGPILEEFVGFIRTRPLAVVVLAPRAEVVSAREAARPKSGYVGGWTVEDLDRSLRLETPRIGLWIDSSDQTPKETVEEVLDRLPAALVDPAP